MNSSTKILFGKRVLGYVSASDYVNWAVEMLKKDYDSPNLRILAGLSPESRMIEVERYFFSCLQELNIDQELNPKVAVHTYASQIAKQIINGQFRSAREAIQPLYQICLDTGYDPNYIVWIELDDALDSLYAGKFPYTYPSATLDNFNDLIKQEAIKLIRMSDAEL